MIEGYALWMREDINSPWTAQTEGVMTLAEAQEKIVKFSAGSPYQWDIVFCQSVVTRMVGEQWTEKPEIVKERG
jgi:hypothetical protein